MNKAIFYRREAEMGKKSALVALAFECPQCKGHGEIDNEQAEGKVSIICECGWHGYCNLGGANP
jgi:hypothetical protein